MSTTTRPGAPGEIEYPDSDGKPMADNTLQFRWIMTITGGLEAAFEDRSDVFVAGDLLWYPIEGDNKTRIAPDVMVALGRPKGDRGSYMQWREGGIAPQVVFEILSPGNRAGAMTRKRTFYEQFGVLEYYIYDPEANILEVWTRVGHRLCKVPEPNGWTSPLLGVRFELEGDQLRLFGPDGQPFRSHKEEHRRADQAERRAEEERLRAEEERLRAEQERLRAEQADRLAEEARRSAEEQRQATERLAARLRALGIDPEV